MGKLFPYEGTDYKATPFGNDAKDRIIHLQEEKGEKSKCYFKAEEKES